MFEDINSKEAEPRIAVEVARERNLERAATTPEEITSLADEETIRILALAAAHPEWQDELFAQIDRDKAPARSGIPREDTVVFCPRKRTIRT
jgi:hypothetical protein